VLTFETRALAVQAAMAGIGATVVDRHLVAGLLAADMLAEVAPSPPTHWTNRRGTTPSRCPKPCATGTCGRSAIGWWRRRDWAASE
jgi:hypothetical protein